MGGKILLYHPLKADNKTGSDLYEELVRACCWVSLGTTSNYLVITLAVEKIVVIQQTIH